MPQSTAVPAALLRGGTPLRSAGASRVYAVEASGMASKAEKLASGNGLSDVIKVVNQRVEDVKLDSRVDVLISEPLGIALVNERMLESYIHARDALLKPGGKMFPDRSTLFAAPFTDDMLYQEQFTKCAPLLHLRCRSMGAVPLTAPASAAK